MSIEDQVGKDRYGIFETSLLALMKEKGISLDEALRQALIEAQISSKEYIPGFRAAAKLIRNRQQKVTASNETQGL